MEPLLAACASNAYETPTPAEAWATALYPKGEPILNHGVRCLRGDCSSPTYAGKTRTPPGTPRIGEFHNVANREALIRYAMTWFCRSNDIESILMDSRTSAKLCAWVSPNH